MKHTTTYCDICGEQTKPSDTYSIHMKWWSESGYHQYDICGDCKREAEENKESLRPFLKTDRTLLGLLRKIVKKAKA